MSGSFDGSGLLLGLDSNITDFAPSGDWTGRLFSGATIHLFSGGAIDQPVPTQPVPTQVPEASTLAILGAALAAMAAITSLRRRA
jgi:MYXO-CTERM domain-containing protein